MKVLHLVQWVMIVHVHSVLPILHSSPSNRDGAHGIHESNIDLTLRNGIQWIHSPVIAWKGGYLLQEKIVLSTRIQRREHRRFPTTDGHHHRPHHESGSTKRDAPTQETRPETRHRARKNSNIRFVPLIISAQGLLVVAIGTTTLACLLAFAPNRVNHWTLLPSLPPRHAAY